VNSAYTDIVSSANTVAKVDATATAAPDAVCVQDDMPDGTTTAQGTSVASKTDATAARTEGVVQDATALVPDVGPAA
jgi:hypothetical protein